MVNWPLGGPVFLDIRYRLPGVQAIEGPTGGLGKGWGGAVQDEFWHLDAVMQGRLEVPGLG